VGVVWGQYTRLVRSRSRFSLAFPGACGLMIRERSGDVAMRVAVVALLVTAFASRAASQDVKYIGDDPFTIGSVAAVVGDVPLVHTAQFLPIDPKGNVLRKDARTQVSYTLADALAAVEAAGGDPERPIRLNVVAANAETVDWVKDAVKRRYDSGKRPTVSLVMGQLPQPDALVGIDAVAPAKGKLDAVKRQRFADFPPVAGGTHTAVLPAGRRVYVSGQAEKGDTPAEATRKTLASLRSTLQWLGLDDAHVVQCKAFLQPITAAEVVTKEFVAHFGAGKVPPLVFVEWKSMLPIEIELIVFAPGESRPGIEFLTPPGMTASPVYTRVTRVKSERLIYTGGLVASKSGRGEEQVTGTFERLNAALKDADSDFDHLVKATYYVSEEETSTALNRLRPKYYDPKRPPAASKAVVAGTGFKDRSLILDLIAVPAAPR
jgi:enamine deaminase RidA (YjgF/YER057c/UK114 family)